ncbi:RIP metalloprotease RseP [Vagococcus xieshaowenii]|uniref:Zinc metalloprotease n=1 Tax=Vagococcus xieshaowenii TaxID=2562451 RepID=A0AAJ5EFE1_9ENTE|nr:RIP metalloprotease RseP [Vagococcus xieshaowenii]QCA28177.1 RIP metalloprotease RseP [Vagococcus xieshaowenii]TFZ42530.1 RIP metalloprotease RseP [Vagococcus xieshaowenii]
MKTLLVFIFVFGLIVVIHELGHFIFAKRSGILVREFAIGMGPKIFSHRDKSGTLYTIRILPMGGYVRMAGMGEEEVALPPGKPLSVELNDKGDVSRINTSHKVTLTNGIPLELLEADLEDKLYLKGYVNGEEANETTYTVDHDATIIEEDGTEVRIAPRDVQFQSAKLYQRMLTNFAGPLFNFILTFVLFLLVLFMQGGVAANDTSSLIGGVQADSPADKAGMKPDDRILEIEGTKVTQFAEVGKLLEKTKDKPINVVVEREKAEKTLTLTPKKVTENGKDRYILGIQGAVRLKKLSFGEKFKEAAVQTKNSALTIFNALKDLIAGFSLDKLGGPVMIYQASSELSNQSFVTILSFIAMLSVNLGIMNLLPIPMLDGGKLLFNIFEGIRRKPLNQEIEMKITLASAILLIGLIVLVTWNDIMRFLGR